MKVELIPFARLSVESDLRRLGRPSQFAHLLEASIREIGLAEPIKAALADDGNYTIIDGVLRFEAITHLREDPEVATRFDLVPAITYPYSRRFELRYQTDIYQDLLPSQLAYLVELLHARGGVTKQQIAASLGIAPATLRNYTGLWRLSSRGDICRRLVDLMDVGVIPASNPFAWLRLTDAGVREALESRFTGNVLADDWVDEVMSRPPGEREPFSLTYVEEATASLPERYYRQRSEVRTKKRSYGLRRGEHSDQAVATTRRREDPRARIRRHLSEVADSSSSPVLRMAATSLVRSL